MASCKVSLLRNKIPSKCMQSFISQDILRVKNIFDNYTPQFVNLPGMVIHRSSSYIASTLHLPNKLCTEESRKKKIIIGKRNQMFVKEQNRQKDLIPRAEKIQVHYKGAPEDVKLLLNKGMSTPFDIAQHITEDLVEQSALALVNGDIWDMGRPLEDDCTVELLHFYMEEPFHLNRAFWRSCSFLLGAALDSVFKEEVNVLLHSFPAPNVTTGSFIYDVDLNISEWSPTKEELMAISASMHRLSERGLPFERLVVDQTLAAEMFADNKYKAKQIPNIASKSKSGQSVTLYRVGDHVDISGGPMVGDTSFLGRRCTIAASHQINYDGVNLYRFQGVALPKAVFLSHFAFGVLEKRASKLNECNLNSAQRVNPV